MAENHIHRTIHSIQSARAIAALLVVMHHISVRFEQRVADRHFLDIFDRFGFAGVDLFFVISGLIMVVTCQRHFGRWAGMPAFLWRRATRIYPLYWFFTIVQLAAILLMPSATDRVITAETIVASFLLLPQSVYPILAPGWTLVYEMYFYLVFSLLFFIPRRFASQFLSAWGLMTIGLYAVQYTVGMSDTTDLVKLPIYASPLTLEFLAGCFIGSFYNRQVNCLATVSLVMGTVWFAVGWMVIESSTTASAAFGLTRVLVFGIASTLVLYGLVALEQRGFNHETRPWFVNHWLIALGNASYSLYLSHLLVINVFAMVWARLSLQGWAIQAWFETVMLVTCIGFAIITYRVIELPLLNRMRDRQQNREPAVAGY